MKASLSAFLFWSGIATAMPTGAVESAEANIYKRAVYSDACAIGFCTLNGGTTGGGNATAITVTTLANLTAAAKATLPAVILVSGALTGPGEVRISSNKTIIGAAGSSLDGINLTIKSAKNVIVRNMKISKVLKGDSITIQDATNVWIDHCDLSSDLEHDKDYYDGQLDITHASDWVTVSSTYFHDHWKTSLVGHSDSNQAEDTNHLHVTYANNRWARVNSRTPSLRFGTAHIFNSLYSSVEATGINTRMGAQVLVESTVFENFTGRAIESADSKTPGYAVVRDVELGGATNAATMGNLTTVPYNYTLLGSAEVAVSVTGDAGQTLAFMF